jgi:hypothetical protein
MQIRDDPRRQPTLVPGPSVYAEFGTHLGVLLFAGGLCLGHHRPVTVPALLNGVSFRSVVAANGAQAVISNDPSRPRNNFEFVVGREACASSEVFQERAATDLLM